MAKTSLSLLVVMYVGFLDGSDVNSIVNKPALKPQNILLLNEINPKTTVFDCSASNMVAFKLQTITEKIKFLEVQIDLQSKKMEEIDASLKSASAEEKASLRDEKKQIRELLKGFQAEKLLLLEREDKYLVGLGSLSATSSVGDTSYFQFLQSTPSSCTASKGQHVLSCLYNGIYAVSFNLPVIVREFLDMEVDDATMQGAKSAIRDGLPKTMFPVVLSETKTSSTPAAETKPSVETIIGIAIQSFFTDHNDPRLACYIKPTLSSLAAANGPAKGNSQPDCVISADIMGGRLPLGVYELKDMSKAPIEQAGQGFASGANIALRQMALGLNYSKIAVPLVLTNGQLYIFAVVSLLDFIPVFHILSDVLDASSASQLPRIIRLLSVMKTFILRQGRMLQDILSLHCEPQNFPALLPFDGGKYFLKLKTQVFNRFAPLHPEFGALPLLWDIFEALSDVDGVEKALGYGEFMFANQKSTTVAIIFNNLYPDGYMMGVPVNDVQYKAFLETLESLVHQIHSHGVIHVDLYPSNILWVEVEGKIKVRIVDWDGATFVNERFPESMLNRFRLCPDRYFLGGSTTATPKNDAWHLFILSDLCESQRERLQGSTASDASKVNSAYLDCISEKNRRLGSELDPAFTAWYESFLLRGAGTAVVPCS